MLDGVLILTGFALIGFMLLDVFETLFNPQRSGSPSHRGLNALWRHTKGVWSGGARFGVLTGPVYILLVIVTWIVAALVGWALIYYVFLPSDAFTYAPGLPAVEQSGLIDALYVSGVVQATLGLGDITPRHDFLRFVVPLQAVVGFLIFTAAITWVLGIYPVLARRQQLAQLLTNLHKQLGEQGFSSPELDQGDVNAMCRELTHSLLAVRSDMLQFPITFYFNSRDRKSNLPNILHRLPSMLDTFPEENVGRRHVPSRGMLRLALDDLTDTLGSQFLIDTADGDVLEAYARFAGTGHS